MDEPESCLINCEMFGKHAEYFESRIVPLWQEIYDALVARARLSKGQTVLDAGSGPGEVALRISPLVGPTGKVVAVDLQEEMLAIARRKARQRRLHNIDFKRMSLEALDLPDSRFDSVVGNYSLCCCSDYEAALAECFRVLKPGGRLTYNHFGPNDPPASEIVYDLFEDYKPRNPSKRLKALRESDEAQMQAVDRYRDPKLAVAAMRTVGFRNVVASLVPRKIRYPGAASYVDRQLEFDWRPEVDEMDPADVRAFRKEAIGKLSRLSRGPGFTIEDETAYFSGTKATGN